MVMRQVLLISSLALMTACSSVPDGSKARNSDSGNFKDQLAPRDLNDGGCGIFVWTADAARRFIFFSQNEKPMANWWSEDGEIEIQRQSSSGDAALDQAPFQSFSLPDGGNLKLDLSDPEDMDNGTRYRSGAITEVNSEGWAKVIPVFGVAACNLKVVGADYSVRTIR